MNFDVFKTINWKTTACAVGYVICKIVGGLYPPVAPVCEVLDPVFVASGFMSAADSARVSNVVQAVDGLLGLKPLVPAVIVTDVTKPAVP